MRDRVGETLARRGSAAVIAGDGRAHAADVGVGREQFQRVVDPRAGAQQQREIAGEDRDILRRAGRENSAKLPSGAPARASLSSATVSIGIRPRYSMRRRDLRRGRRGERAADDFAGLGSRRDSGKSAWRSPRSS